MLAYVGRIHNLKDLKDALNAADATGGHIWTRLVAQCTISYVQCTISCTVVQSVVKSIFGDSVSCSVVKLDCTSGQAGGVDTCPLDLSPD